MKRREFIRQTTAAISTTAISARRFIGANDRVAIGLIGCGGRGLDVARLMLKVSGVEYGAVCDVYAPNAERAKQQLNSASRVLGDFRRLLELKEIDAVHLEEIAMNTRSFFVAILISIFVCAVGEAQNAKLITANSAGKVKIGMSVSEARKAVAPLKLSRTSDGEGVALIGVKRGKAEIMTLYAGEEDRDAPINDQARVEQIWVWDRSFKTVNGVHPEMLLIDAEKKYGGVREVVLTQIESREFVEFANHPKGIEFRLGGPNDYAGVYLQNKNRATSFKPGSYIFSINVVGGDAAPSQSAKDAVKYSSEYTDLKTGCRSVGGKEGGHVSTFCKGPGGYQAHYFDTATTYQLNVVDRNRDWEKGVTMFGLGDLKNTKPLEWRLANGVPFAAIFTHPGNGKVFVTGLKGFERIKFEEEGQGSLDRARSMADARYADIITPATRIYFAGNSTSAVVKGKIAAIGDKLKYVVKAKAGDRLTVRIKPDKWTGQEGPILVVTLELPDGSGLGEPGGIDAELTQDGDHEIVVYQNRAKSQTENIELTITVTLTP